MSGEADELQPTIVRRIVRHKLSQASGKDVQLNKDAVLAFSESAKVFIHYLAATANEICVENKRATVNAADILAAIKEVDFPEFIAPLEATLAAFREETKQKKTDGKPKAAPKKPGTSEIGIPRGTGQEDGVNNDENGESPDHRKEADDGPGDALPGIVGQDDDVDILEGEGEGMQERE